MDYNKIQSLGRVDEVLKLDPIANKFEAFGWHVIEVDGHDLEALHRALDLDNPPIPGMPTVIIAHTVKGKGVDFMEDKLMWHYKSPNQEQMELALSQIGASFQ
ncbi:Transketolase 2 [compost metagenome]